MTELNAASRWLVFGGLTVGPDHEGRQEPCQDAWAMAAENGLVFVAVADGAGSAARGGEGAWIAVDAAVTAMSTQVTFGRPIAVEDACRAARAALERAASQADCELRSFACTLLLVAACGESVNVCHIGDGAVAIRDARTKEVVLLSPPDAGEYANETWFITSDSWQQHLRRAWHPSADGLVMFSDGCEPAALQHSGVQVPYAPFFEDLLSFADTGPGVEDANKQVAELLSSPAMRASSMDDKVLVVAARLPEQR